MRPRHPLAGKTVRLKVAGGGVLDGTEYVVEDWWENVSGKPWMTCEDNPACWRYRMRWRLSHLPLDNEVVYGKVDGLGYLVHVSELGEEC